MVRRVTSSLGFAALFAAANAHAGEDDTPSEAAAQDVRRRPAAATQRSFDEEYASWFGGGRYPPHFLRAVVEAGALTAAGAVYYWKDPLANQADQDNPSFGDRLTLQALRFDSNLNTTNHLLHPGAGMLTYDFARENGLSIPTSFLFTVVQSVAWEFLFEWREKPSINDLVFTTVGGLPLGEVLFHATDYVNSAPARGGPLNKAAAWTIGFPRAIHRALDHGEGTLPVPLPADALGFSSAYGHRFRIGYEFAGLSNDVGRDGWMGTLRWDSELVAMPRFLQPGAFTKTFADGNFTEFHARFGGDGSKLVESDIEARATLFGRYAQDFHVTEGGDVDGHAFMFGVGPALRFQWSDWLGREDQLSTVHVAGPHAELWVRDGSFGMRLGGEAYVDFASIASLAYPRFVARYGAEGLKSVLERRGYQYSFGTWARFRADAAFGPVLVGGSIGTGSYGTIEGYDRFQEEVTNDAHGSEFVLETMARAAVCFGPLSIGAGLRERRRESTLATVDTRRNDRDLHLDVAVTF